MSSARHGWAHAGYWRLPCSARHCCHQARAMLGAPWPAQGMAGQAHAGYSRCCTRHCIARQGQCWVPHGQRKAWLGSRWVPMAWGITQGKTGCPRCSARHCQGKAECPRCSARGELPFPPHCSTLTTRIGGKLPFFHQCKTLVKRIGGKLPFFPYAKHWTA